MKILINAVSARAGGGVSYLANLLDHLPQQLYDCELKVAVPEMSDSLPENLPENLELIKIPEASGNVFTRFFWENFYLPKLCKSTQADLLYCVANIAPLIDPGVPIVTMIQNAAPLTPAVLKKLWHYEPATKALQMLLLKALTLHALKKSKRVIALSKASDKLIKMYVPECKTSIIYHGASPHFVPDAPVPDDAPSGKWLIFVSNLYVYKGLEILLDALEADKTIPPILVIGKEFDLGYLKHIKKLVSDKKLENRLVFTGPKPSEELPGWYANASAMVYSSWCEACPIILLEAMACGCPVVTMNTGPMPEICGNAGIYARPFDGKDLARAIKRSLAITPNERRQLHQRAKKFSWQNAMKRHRETFFSALDDGNY